MINDLTPSRHINPCNAAKQSTLALANRLACACTEVARPFPALNDTSNGFLLRIAVS